MASFSHSLYSQPLSGMVERYGVIQHAYVLMGNHYNLLVESPQGNVSRAMQWLNTGYGVWFNLKHGRSGALYRRVLEKQGEAER